MSNPQSNPTNVSEPSSDSKPSRSSDTEQIRALVEVYFDVQDLRIRSFNRLRQVGELRGVNPDHLRDLEKEIKNYIKDAIKDVPIFTSFLDPIKGIGPILAGGLISWLDPHKAKHASSFWKYCGLHVEDSKAVRRTKGKKVDFNPRMRVLAWKIADSFIKQRTPGYRELYDQTKVEENAKLGNPTEDYHNCPLFPANCDAWKRIQSKAKRLKKKGVDPPCGKHIDYRARRKMVKRFLRDLWVEWRMLLGLPVSEPYAVRILGHAKEEEPVA